MDVPESDDIDSNPHSFLALAMRSLSRCKIDFGQSRHTLERSGHISRRFREDGLWNPNLVSGTIPRSPAA